MATRELNPNEINLNSKFYKIIGHIRPRLASVFPGKVVTGDYSKDSEQVSSSWIINDQRGGIGIEEMDEAKDADRSWWTNCGVRFKGHMTLPPLATEITLPSLPTITDGGLEAWTTATNLTNWTEAKTGSASVDQEATIIHGGTYSCKLSPGGGAGQSASISQTLTGWSNDLRGATIRVHFWARQASGTGHVARVTAGNTTNVNVTADGTWHKNVVTVRVSATATEITLVCDAVYATSSQAVYFDDIDWENTSDATGIFCNFNGDTFFANGSIIYKEDTSTGSDFHVRGMMPATITHLISGVNGCMYVFMGDNTNYQYMSSDGGSLVDNSGVATGSPITLTSDRNTITVTTAGTFTVTLPASGTGTATSGTAAVTGSPQALVAGANTVTITGTGTFTIDTHSVFTGTDHANAQLGVHWANKLWKINTSGQLAYAATPNAASPGWTNDALLPVTDTGTIQRIEVARDADNVLIIYVGTESGLWAYDNTNTRFLATDMTLPMHPNGSKGLCRWRDAAYVSAGLDVFKYQPSQGAIRQIGLSKDDGLPIEQNGEVVALVRGHAAMYALVDASQSTGTGYSSVVAYDEVGWHPNWTTATADGAMHNGIVSSAYSYQLFFDHNGKIVMIPLHRSLGSPLKFSTDTYATAGLHISPWFDGGTIWYKTAGKLKVYTAGCSATETVVVKYRIDHATTARDTTWTTLGTITTNGETIYSFGSSAGIAFKTIQFRFDLARGGTTTVTPDVQSVSLAYTKNLPASYAWSLVLDLSDEQGYRGKAVADKIADLETIINGNVNVPFIFTHSTAKAAETHYVKVYSLSGEHSTGEDKTATYNLVLVEP